MAGMVDVRHKRCACYGCIFRSSCGTSSAFCLRHAAEITTSATSDNRLFGGTRTATGRERGSSAEDGNGRRSRAARPRKIPGLPAALTRVSSSDSDSVRSKKRPRRADVVPALGVSIKRGEGERLADEARESSSQRRRACPTGEILLRLPPTLRMAGGGDTAMKTEVDVRGQEDREHSNH